MIPKQFKNRKPKKPYIKWEKYRMRMTKGSIYMYISEKIMDDGVVYRSNAKRNHIKDEMKYG